MGSLLSTYDTVLNKKFPCFWSYISKSAHYYAASGWALSYSYLSNYRSRVTYD